jgi:hypothetical protein
VQAALRLIDHASIDDYQFALDVARVRTREFVTTAITQAMPLVFNELHALSPVRFGATRYF